MTVKSLSEARDGKSGSRFNVGQMKLFINSKEYWIHPVYNLYGANKQGEVIHISKYTPMKGNYNNRRYLQVVVRGSGDLKRKCVFVHRFIYECYHGIIPDGMVIDHINDIRDDNRLCNLQLVTQQQNSQKAAKNRDYTFVANNHKNKKRVKATNLETNEISYYNSLSAAHKHLSVARSIIWYCCKGINHVKHYNQ